MCVHKINLYVLFFSLLVMFRIFTLIIVNCIYIYVTCIFHYVSLYLSCICMCF